MSVVGKKDKVSRILISLDCILDTRLAVIMDINPSLVDKVLVNKDFNYHERLSDEFPDVDKSDFNARYSNRDITILAQSRVTNIFNFLIESNEILQTEIETKQDVEELKYVINTYPYLLTQKEIEDIVFCFRYNMKKQHLNVSVVWLPLEKITIDFCNSDITAMFMYDYDEWMSLHVEGLKKTSLHDVTLFAPMLYKEKPPTSEDIEELKEAGMNDPFVILSTAVREMIELFFLPINEFSVYKPE